MSKTIKWVIGIAIALVVLQFAMPFVWQLIFPNAYAGYGVMGRGYGNGFGYGMHMPMMGYGYDMMNPFGMFFMWLIPLGTLILIALGVVWLAKQLMAKSS